MGQGVAGWSPSFQDGINEAGQFLHAARTWQSLGVARSMRGKLMDTTPEQFRELMELNLIALTRCTRAAVPHLLAQRGHVVNIGSLAATSAIRSSVSAATKW